VSNTPKATSNKKTSTEGSSVPSADSKGPLIQTGDPKTMPPPLELQKRYLTLQTADLNVTLSRMDEETQLLDLRIKPLRPGMRCAGLAVTWHAMLSNYDPNPDGLPVSWRTKTWDYIYPGSILVYQPGGDMSAGHLGNLFGNMVHSRGAMGAIIDGNVRDAYGHTCIENWNPFSRGASPLEAAPYLKWMTPNTPILMSGELRRYIDVYPGDMVLADDNGVIIVPKKLILPVLLESEDIRSKEIPAEKAYASGADPLDVIKKYNVS
jgi:4-hydroxy-4-methyl-2-oxoglutarate aldolase